MRIIVKPYWKRNDGWILAAVGLVLSAVGTGMQMKGQADAQNRQDDERSNELARQSRFQQAAREVVAKQVAQAPAEMAKPAIQSAADARAAEYNRITAIATPSAKATAGRTVTPPMAKATAQQGALTAAWNKILGGAQSKLGAYQDWGLSRSIAQQRGSQDIATIGGDAQRSAQVSGAEQRDAGHAGDGLIAAGGLVGLAGQGVGTYAATQPNATQPGWGEVPEAEAEMVPGYGWKTKG